MSGEGRLRLYCLQDLEQMLAGFYHLYAKQVNLPYSKEGQQKLVKIVRLLEAQVNPKSGSGTSRSVSVCVTDGYFRFELPEKDPFSLESRLRCLTQLHEFLVGFFAAYGGHVAPLSYKEKSILKRIGKIFIHQLRGSDKYRLFKKKSSPRHLSDLEQEELRNQQTDELRLRIVGGNIVRYNPLSEKYKALKEETLRKIHEMDGLS